MGERHHSLYCPVQSKNFWLTAGSEEGEKYSSSNTLQQALALMVCIGSLSERIFSLLHE